MENTNVEYRKHHNERAVVMSLNEIKRLGTSKYLSREAYNAEMRALLGDDLPWRASPYIHSIETYIQYLYLGKQYAGWLAEEHPEVTKLSYAFRMGYAREYIQRMIDLDYAPSTVNRATCALAKLHRCGSNDIHNDRPLRCYIDFTRSRSYSEEQYRKDIVKYFDKYGPIVEICRITGVRESELERLSPECFKTNTKGQLYVHLDGKLQNTKGGKTRDIVIIPANQDRMREILATLEPGKLICPIAPSHLDVHGIRSLYATDYYDDIARPIEDIPRGERLRRKHPKKDKKRGTTRYYDPGVYRRRSDGRKFDRKALLLVSLSLGHNREDVVIASYLR